METWRDKSLGSEQPARSVDTTCSVALGAGLGRLALRSERQRANGWILAAACAGWCGLSGCSGQSSFLTGGPTMGQLKTSLSHLEYENEQLKKSTAKLQRENRSMEDRLVQEQMENGDLTARLDDARNLLRDRGVDADVRLGSHRGGETLGGTTSDRASEGEGLPDGSRSRRRKTPFAQISAGNDSGAKGDADDAATDTNSEDRPRSRTRRSGRPTDDDRDQHSFHKAPQSWMPIADNTDDSIIQIR
jgi:hypothetical protein